MPLSDRIGCATSQGTYRALRLGPGEWQIDASASKAAQIATARAGCGPHALVEVTDREVIFHVEGSGALDLLSIGTAREVGRREVGRGARTVFDSVQAILIREG